MTQSNESLIGTLKKRKRTSSLYDQYIGLSSLFNRTVHPQITSLAIATDGIFLTDHGPDHIAQVIKKADQLLFQSKEKISVYEAFLLLVAIHLHDIGNALGRIGHEQKADEIFSLVYGPLGFDELDKILAERIASVHGGRFLGSKDTIKSLDADTYWKNEPVRPQFLAAVLKLADEMAEDRHRANAVGVELDKIKKTSEVHHIYAYGLHSIVCDAKACTMKMSFAYEKSYFQKELGSGEGTTNLLEEIYTRSLKMYSEALYCSRYFRGAIRIDRVSVIIEIFKKGDLFQKKIIPYVIEPTDYEDHGTGSIYDRAISLKDFEGKGNLTAELLTEILKD